MSYKAKPPWDAQLAVILYGKLSEFHGNRINSIFSVILLIKESGKGESLMGRKDGNGWKIEQKIGREKKLALLALLLGFFCFLTALATVGRLEGSSETALLAFERANFSEMNCHIYREGYLNSEFYLEEEKEAFLNEVSRQWDSEKGELSLALLVREEQPGECEIRQENYLRADVRLLQGASTKEALEERARLMALTDEAGIEGTVYLEFEGCFPGELSREEQRTIAESLMEKMGAEVVAGMDEEELYTLYAYVKGAGETKKLPEGAVNMNLAVSYDEIADKTVFHLGCPILSEDW